MAELSDFMPMIGMTLSLPATLGGIFLIQYNAYLGVFVLSCGYAIQFGWIFVARRIMRWRAGLIHHLILRRTSDEGQSGWNYVGQAVLRWTKHPSTLKVRVRNFRCPDGHIEPLVQITPIKLPRLINRVRHPAYNRGGTLPGAVLVHPLPYDLQFKESEDFVHFGGYNVKISTVSWGIGDEIMPRVIKILGLQIHNLIPSVDQELLHWPWYFVPISSGTRANQVYAQKPEPQRPLVAVAVGGISQYFCPTCKEPLTVDKTTNVGKCRSGHEFDMRRPVKK